MKKTSLLTLTLLISFICIELLLRLSVHLVPSNPLAPPRGISTSDPVLGHRFKPGAAGHDQWGFRNDSVYSRADVLVLGDSQTYGSGVKKEENWPSRLQQQTGLKVYNMALGGWGPVESMLLLEEGLRLKPRLVIEALYSGNDFHDCYTAAYYRLQLDSLKTCDPSLAAAVDSAERVEKYNELVARTHSFRRNKKREGTIYRLKNWLYANLFTYKLLSISKSKILSALESDGNRIKSIDRKQSPTRAQPTSMLTEKRWADSKKAAELYPTHYLIFESGEYRTILTPAYRGVATDTDDPRVREGVQLATASIARMAARLRKEEIPFLVLLIPTKELVFGQMADSINTRNDEARRLYFEMLGKETNIWDSVKASFDSAGIAWLDGLDCLRDAFSDGIQPYMVTENGHPDVPGHQALASCVASWIEKEKPFTPSP